MSLEIKTFNYGIHHNQLIIHAIGKLWLDDNRNVFEVMVNDPRVKPGMLITMLGASEILYTPEECDEIVRYLASLKPKAITAIVYGEVAHENEKILGSLLKARGIQYMEYSCLEDMFDYIMEKGLT
jgi:hypothetical protein